MVASYKGRVDVVDKLLQHGATVDLQGNVHNATIHIIYMSQGFIKSPIAQKFHANTLFVDNNEC